MPLHTSDRIASEALKNAIDPLDHFGMVGWCDSDVDGFASLDQPEKHSFAAEVQVKLALLQRRITETEEWESDGEGGVRLECEPIVSTPESRVEEEQPAHPAGKKKKTTKPPVVNHVTQSIDDISSRVVQADLDLQHPNHSLIVWAWCVFSVSGFVESHQRIRKEILQAVIEHLVNGDVILEDSKEAAPSSGEPESPEIRAKRRKEKRKEKWYNQVKEPAERIAHRFPHQQLDYSNVNRIAAWCILHVDGFVESGVIPRNQIRMKVQEVLEKRYGPYEGGVGD